MPSTANPLPIPFFQNSGKNAVDAYPPPLVLYDTHCHLSFPDFEDDQKEVIKRAQKEGVEKIILASASVEESQKNIRLAAKYISIWTMVGIHPHNTDPESTKNNLEALAHLCQPTPPVHHSKIVAIGETGLDYTIAPPPEKSRSKREQADLFQAQLQLAQKLQLPTVIHSRSAARDTLDIIKNFPKVTKIIHCFTYPYIEAKHFLDLGCYLSFTGIITFPNARELRETVKKIPLEKIVLETDAPFLAPQPYRGQRNEPGYVKILAEKIAEVKEISVEKVAETTTRNAEKLFWYGKFHQPS